MLPVPLGYQDSAAQMMPSGIYHTAIIWPDTSWIVLKTLFCLFMDNQSFYMIPRGNKIKQLLNITLEMTQTWLTYIAEGLWFLFFFFFFFVVWFWSTLPRSFRITSLALEKLYNPVAMKQPWRIWSPFCRTYEPDLQKMDRQTGRKWLIQGTKHPTDNRHKARNPPAKYTSLECRPNRSSVATNAIPHRRSKDRNICGKCVIADTLVYIQWIS